MGSTVDTGATGGVLISTVGWEDRLPQVLDTAKL